MQGYYRGDNMKEINLKELLKKIGLTKSVINKQKIIPNWKLAIKEIKK